MSFPAIKLSDEAATRRLAARVANLIEAGSFVGLVGELGSGKTAFTRGFADAFGCESQVASPSYVLEHIYKPSREKRGIRRISHWDLYRLEPESELEELLDHRNSGDTVALIEWADRSEALEPFLDYLIEIRFLSEESQEARQALIRRCPQEHLNQLLSGDSLER